MQPDPTLPDDTEGLDGPLDRPVSSEKKGAMPFRTWRNGHALVALTGLLFAAGCGAKSRASARDSWALTVSNEGQLPRHETRYDWKAMAGHPCTLKVVARGKGVRVPPMSEMILSMESESRGEAFRIRFTVEDARSLKGREGLWAKGTVLAWDVTAQGHTLGISATFQALRQGGPQVDLGLLLERGFPPLPTVAVGTGASWQVRRSRRIGLPEGMGLGSLVYRDEAGYVAEAVDRQTLQLSWKGRLSTSGRVTPLGHEVVVRGSGRIAGRARIVRGVLVDSRLTIREEFRLKLDGKPRSTDIHLDARFSCPTP